MDRAICALEQHEAQKPQSSDLEMKVLNFSVSRFV